MTTTQLQEGVLDAVQKRIELAQEAEKLYRADAEAEHAYLMAVARAYLQVDGKNADERKAQVHLIVDKVLFAHKIAEAQATLAKLGDAR